MKTLKKIMTMIVILMVVVTVVFLIGRFGWKLGGFHACQGAGITSLEVNEKDVHITGFYPGSFPEGFCGYYAKEEDGTLYVGFHFSAVFGFFETGNFDITIPVKNKINEVVIKTKMNEFPIWNKETGLNFQSDRNGVYVKLERNDVYSISMSYAGSSGSMNCTDHTAMDCGVYHFIDNDIMMVSKDLETVIPFTISVKDADGKELVSQDFSFDASKGNMYLLVTAEGKIMEDNNGEE
ncbi:MAG: hypothetical protein PUF50_00500 [Erysipelotrichaceae bacterium]|nr:hypothetical protein [Erysipelotrichaceae bacterium]